MRILLLGATGQVGWELERTLSVLGDLITSSRSANSGLKLDISDQTQLRTTLDSVAPDVIVNATAYTAVDKAESEPERAMRLNGEVPAEIGAWAAAHDALAVHYSTDYVFDGAKDAPYAETDTTNPVSVYGRTKLAGDQALLASGCATIILRVSWVYGLRGQNFLLTMRRLMRQRGALRIVNDQFGAPTWCRSIAQATSGVLAKMPSDSASRRDLSGVYHLSPGGGTSWFGFATAVRDLLSLQCDLQPISTSEYPTPAQRPKNSRLDSTKLLETFGLAIPAWDRDLRLCVDGLLSG
jgi:dTDP-4-dehydrorhamnose reductase